MPTFTFSGRTDDNGFIQKTERFDPPRLPIDFRVDTLARLEAPYDTEVRGIFDLDAADGNPTNQAREFGCRTGETLLLGKWWVDRAENIIQVSAHTIPIRANTELIVVLDVNLVIFQN